MKTTLASLEAELLAGSSDERSWADARLTELLELLASVMFTDAELQRYWPEKRRRP